jgi:hypothetical protein
LAVNPKSIRQTSPGAALGIFLFHHVQHTKVFVSATITIAKEIGFLFQVEDCGSKAPAFFAGKLRKFSENFGRAHQPSN